MEWKDAAYCYRCSVVYVCVCLLDISKSCAKTDDRDAVWGADSGRLTKPCWGPDPQGKRQFWGPLRCGLSSKFFDHLLMRAHWCLCPQCGYRDERWRQPGCVPAVKISFPVESRKVSWTTMESQRLFIDSRLIHCPGSTQSAHLSGTCRFYCFSPGLREKSPDLGRGVARNVCERWGCRAMALLFFDSIRRFLDRLIPSLALGNESVPIKLARCWFRELAISNAKI